MTIREQIDNLGSRLSKVEGSVDLSLDRGFAREVRELTTNLDELKVSVIELQMELGLRPLDSPPAEVEEVLVDSKMEELLDATTPGPDDVPLPGDLPGAEEDEEEELTLPDPAEEEVAEPEPEEVEEAPNGSPADAATFYRRALTIEDAAGKYGVPVGTVRRLINRRKLGVSTSPDGTVKVSGRELREVLSGQS